MRGGMTAPPAGPLKAIWAALLASMLALFAVSIAMRPRLPHEDGLGVLTWMSIAWAVLSTVTAVLLRTVAAETGEFQKQRGLHVASMATLESGVLLAGVIHLVSPLEFGIYAALLPVAAMLAFIPRD
jgi:hypothetical protein